MTFLTIAIPTFNRCKKLQRTLESFALQVASGKYDGIEILVSDNASTDDTELVCRDVAKRYPQVPFRYTRNEQNLGFDRNVHNAVERANGTYVWTFSDDDVPVQNAVHAVYSQLIKEQIVFGFVNYNILVNGKIIESRYGSGATEWLPAKEILATIKFSNSLISSCIFRRQAWLLNNPSQFFGSLWIHFYMSRQILLSGIGLIIGDVVFAQHQDDLEQSRRERRNPEASAIEFYVRAHLSFLEFAAGLQGSGHAYETFRQADTIGRREDLYQIANYKLTAANYSPMQILRTWRAFARHRAKSAAFWFVLTPSLLLPTWFFKMARSVYRTTRRS